MSQVLTNPKFLQITSSGTPLSGGKVYTYAAGTTTPKTTYSDSTLSTALSNPIILNSRGESDTAIYLNGSYKIVLKDSDGVEVWTMDNVEGQGATIYNVTSVSDYADLATAISSIGSNETDLWIDQDCALSADLTIPDNINLRVEKGVTIAAGTYNLTLNCHIDAGEYTFVTGSGTITVSSTANPIIYKKWTSASASGVTGNSVLDEDDMTSDSDVKLVTQQSIKAYVDVVSTRLLGQFERSEFEYNGTAAAYTVKVKGGTYLCKDKVSVLPASVTTNAIGSPSASTFYYLYLDYSAITSFTEITATELIWSDTSPTWNTTYKQWMNGDDRCIFSVLSHSGDSNIREFFHDGSDIVFYSTYVRCGVASTTAHDFQAQDCDSWTDCYLAIPAFSRRALLKTAPVYSTATSAAVLSWRTNEQTETNGHPISSVLSGNDVYAAYNTNEVITDSNNIIELSFNDVDAHLITADITAWYFPKGM